MKKQLKLAIFLFILVGFNSRGVIFTSNGQDKSGESSLNEFKRYQDGVDSKSNRKSPCSSNTRTITDMFGRDVEITSEVSRIVTTGAGALRLVIYMNGTDKVVGVENIERDEEVDPELDMRPYNLAHPEIRELPSIGPIWGGDKELIVDVNPEVVITTNEEQASDLDSLQDSLNVPVIGLIYGDLDESLDFLWEALNITARVLGTYERFTEFKTNLEDIFADLNSRTSNIENVSRPSVYVAGVSHRGSHGIESTKPGYDPFNLVNADNVADELDTDHAFVDKEQVLAWDPDIIFLDGGGFALTLEDLNSGIYDGMQAVQHNEIYVLLPYNYYTANFANILVDAYYVGSILYPDLFADIDLDTKSREIYEKFVGLDVYDNLMQNFKNNANSTQNALSKLHKGVGSAVIDGFNPIWTLFVWIAVIFIFMPIIKKRTHKKGLQEGQFNEMRKTSPSF